MVSNTPPSVKKLNNTNQNILTDSTIDKLLNKNTITNSIENLINNTNNNTMDNIITDSEVERLLSNNNVKNNPISDILTNEEIDKLFSNTDPNITIPMHTKKIVVPNKHNTIVLQKNTKKQNNIQVKNNKGKNNIRLTIADNNKNKKPMKKIKIPQLNINTDENNKNISRYLSDGNNTIGNNKTIKIFNVNKVNSKNTRRRFPPTGVDGAPMGRPSGRRSL